jgi:hypothetical protein
MVELIHDTIPLETTCPPKEDTRTFKRNTKPSFSPRRKGGIFGFKK